LRADTSVRLLDSLGPLNEDQSFSLSVDDESTSEFASNSWRSSALGASLYARLVSIFAKNPFVSFFFFFGVDDQSGKLVYA
jgi:hypothetical protein